MSVTINRKNIRFCPNAKRVITRFFMPGNNGRAATLINHIMNMPESATRDIFNQILRKFSSRHRNITSIFESSYIKVSHLIREIGVDPDNVSTEKRLIIGAYFTAEYSIESAAFFNPSIVEDPYQGGLQTGQKRIIVSFRVTGEGHLSSIAFRSGIIDADNELFFEKPGDFVDIPKIVTRHIYEKDHFIRKLNEMNIQKTVIQRVLGQLGDTFIYGELQAAIAKTMREDLSFTDKNVVQAINWLATSHYEVTFSLDTPVSDRILYPVSYTESNGIEDARFVKFTHDDGSAVYYATYTAYNGFAILPKLIETRDFYHFNVMPLNGQFAQNKGMALFPRKINGQYAMLSRVDGVNNYVMFSDDIHLWQNARIISKPVHPWELVQVGNCGSPIETEHGWLVVTHGVGPMRSYSLGACLLDLEDPTRVIGCLKDPLLTPNDEEREGYVPNVVYSCGSIIHNNELIMAYAMSDYASAFASFPLDELFDALLPSAKKKTAPHSAQTPAAVLVADDNPDVRSFITKALCKAGYDVHAAVDGIDALMQMSSKSFRLIITDIEMPNFNGLQVLEQMNERGIQIPVIFITGHHNETYRQKSIALGAAGYLEKPIKLNPFLDKIRSLLES